MAKKEESKSEERVYTIPLRKEWLKTRRVNRGKRSINTVKRFLSRHMHADEVKISQRISETIWARGSRKPPARIRVKARLDEEGKVFARLPEEMDPEKLKESKKGKEEKKPEEKAPESREAAKAGEKAQPGEAAKAGEEKPQPEASKPELKEAGKKDESPKEVVQAGSGEKAEG